MFIHNTRTSPGSHADAAAYLTRCWACRSPKMCPCPAGPLSARIVHSHAGYHTVCVSLRSTTGLWASSRRCGEPSLATAAGRIQEAAEKAGSNAMGSTVLGRSVPGLEPLAAGAGFRSARYGGSLATRTVSQILGRTLETYKSSPRKAGGCARSPQIGPADGDRQSPVASSSNSWGAEDAGHYYIGANRLPDSTICSAATFSDVGDVSP